MPNAYVPQAEDDFGLLSTRGIRPPKLRADAASHPNPESLEPREGDVAVNSFYGSAARSYAPGSALASGGASGGASRVYALRRDAGAGGSRGSGGTREASPAQVQPVQPPASGV